MYTFFFYKSDKADKNEKAEKCFLATLAMIHMCIYVHYPLTFASFSFFFFLAGEVESCAYD